LKGANGSDEDVLTYAMFPKVAPTFFESRAQGRKSVGKDPSSKAAEAKASEAKAPAAAGGGSSLSGKVNYVITLNGKEHRVSVAAEK
jgi:methylmalonyl-CoA carboxyltransferase 5S subunit